MESTLNSRFKITLPKCFFLTFFIILFFTSFLSFPRDDGLRHVGVAFYADLTWKDVYPFSYFSEYSPYSPWYGYDLILKKSLALLRYLPFQNSTLKFFFIKIISLLMVFFVFLVLISKSKIIQEIDSFRAFILASICVFMFLTYFFVRSIFVRPFVFGTIFTILSIGASGFLRGCIYSIILTFLYPYLSWFYILPVAFCHFFLGDKKFCVGLLTIIISFFLIQELSFWKLQLGLFNSASVREQMGMNISELSFTPNSFYCMFILIVIILFYPVSHKNTSKLNYGDLILVVYLIPSIMYIRTFVDVLSPLAFVVYSKSLMPILKSMLHQTIEAWRPFLLAVKTSVSERMPNYLSILIKKTSVSPSKISLKPLLTILYAILILFAIKINFDQLKIVNDIEKFLSIIPQNSTILSSFNQQYQVLFVRPDLKIIPSSEIGMPSPEIRDEYIDFFKQGYFKNLASKTSASYLIEAKDVYLNPFESRYLELIGSHNKLHIWKILESPK